MGIRENVFLLPFWPTDIEKLFHFNHGTNKTYNLRNRETDLMFPQPQKEFSKKQL